MLTECVGRLGYDGFFKIPIRSNFRAPILFPFQTVPVPVAAHFNSYSVDFLNKFPFSRVKIPASHNS